VTRLAAAAVAAGAGLGAAEKVIRAGLQRLGAGGLEDLLAAGLRPAAGAVRARPASQQPVGSDLAAAAPPDTAA
jgi:hypothetical protein